MPPQTALFLPPGVVAPSAVAQAATAGGPPFDRAFFEQTLPRSITAFCSQVVCTRPIVELYTVDGARHYVQAIAGVSERWVALHTKREDHDHDIQVFLPFGAIYRVEIHPDEDDAERRLGFLAIMDAEDDGA